MEGKPKSVTALQRLPQVEIQLNFQIESFFFVHHRPHKIGLERNKELILFKETATCKVAAPKSEKRSLRSAFDRLITNSLGRHSADGISGLVDSPMLPAGLDFYLEDLGIFTS